MRSLEAPSGTAVLVVGVQQAQVLRRDAQGRFIAGKTFTFPGAHLASAIALDGNVCILADAAGRRLIHLAVATSQTRSVDVPGIPRTLRRHPRATPDGRRAFWLCHGTPHGEDRLTLLDDTLQVLTRFESVGPVPIDLVCADTDGDGTADLNVLNLGHSQLSTRRGIPGTWPPAFAPPATTYAGQIVEHLDLHDVDGDGDLDWLTTAPRTQTVHLTLSAHRRPALPEVRTTPKAPVHVARGAEGLGFVWCEGAQAFWHAPTARAFPCPGRSMAGATVHGRHLVSYDSLHREVLWFELPQVHEHGTLKLVETRPVPAEGDVLGPITHGTSCLLGAHGARHVMLLAPGRAVREIPLPFECAAVTTSPEGSALVVGVRGELARVGEERARLLDVRLTEGITCLSTCVAGPDGSVALACSRGREVHLYSGEDLKRLTFRTKLVLPSPARALALAYGTGMLHVFAACPEAHLVVHAHGPFASEPWSQTWLGSGLHPRDLVLEPNTSGSLPTVHVLCTFSNGLVSLQPLQ